MTARICRRPATRVPVSALSLDPSHQLLLVGHYTPEEALSLWDITDPRTPAEILTIPLVLSEADTSGVEPIHASFSGSGELLAVEYAEVHSDDLYGTLVFAVGPDLLEARACSLAARTLTQRELRRFSGSDARPDSCA